MAGELKGLVIGTLFLALIVVGAGMFIGGFNAAYPGTAQNVSASNFSVLNRSSDMYDIANNMSSSLQAQQSQTLDLGGIVGGEVTGAYNVAMLLFKSVAIVQALAAGIGDLLVIGGVPVGWAIPIILIAILAYVSFAILSAVFKWEF